MARAKELKSTDGVAKGVLIFCPACGHGHLFNTTPARPGGPTWAFNGNFERPTFTPSMLVFDLGNPAEGIARRTICHSFVTNGQIKYLDDCAHAMKGQTVDLPDIDAMETNPDGI